MIYFNPSIINKPVVVPLCHTDIKGTTSPAERCDLCGVKPHKVHEFFQVCLNLCQRSSDNMWLIMARYEIKVGQICTGSLT